MSPIQYRPMILDDHDRVTALWSTTRGVKLREADSIDGIGKYLRRNPGLSFVAEQDENIVGTIMGGHDGKRGYIQHLAVADTARRRGIGGKLVELCLTALKKEGILKSHIMILADNSGGKAFWRSQGWYFREDIELYSFINGADPNV